VNRSEQAAAYALGELDGPERAAFEARLAEDAELRREVEAMRATMGALEGLPGDAWPGGAAQPIESDGRLDAPTTPTPTEPGRPRRTWTLRPAFALAALVLALAIGGAAGALLASGGGSEASAPTAIRLDPLDAPAAAGADISMPAADTMLLHVHDLPPSAAGDYYEVWLMDDAEKLVPVASFRVGDSGAAEVEVPLPADPTAYRYFDVSRQQVAGGTGHSGDSVLRGPT
jgi:anti-sigma-K factor RskA